jgi:hypothetical protein
MSKSSRHISDSDSDISDDSSLESLSFRVIELENALCNQDKLLCKIFHENKKSSSARQLSRSPRFGCSLAQHRTVPGFPPPQILSVSHFYRRVVQSCQPSLPI